MDWNILKDKVNEITEDNNYNYISRYDIDKLKLGMHIKYIKNDKLYNGGFLVDILNNDNIVNMVLILKSNIIWKLRFIKYKVYGKQINNFNKSSNIQNLFKIEYKNIIDKRTKEIEDEINKKLENIKNKKYNIEIK